MLRDETGRIDVRRWPRGEQDSILPPAYSGCRVDDREIVATFHTHPNTGPDYQQEPSETDLRSVRDDPDLKGTEYAGEFVVSAETIYLILPTGRMREVGATSDLLSIIEGV